MAMRNTSSLWRYFIQPRSAFSQIFLLISCLLLISQIIAYLTVSAYFIQPAQQQINQLIARQIEALLAEECKANMMNNVDLINQRIEYDDMRAYSKQDAIKQGLKASENSPQLSQDMSALLGQETEVRYQELKTEHKLLIWIRTTQAPDVWLKVAVNHFEDYQLAPFTLYLLMIAGLSVVGGWVLARQQNRSLKILEQAALKVSDGQYPDPLELHGSSEVIAVTEAFNLMTSNMKQLEQDRNLLMAGISHDLRTPLTRIRLACEMLPIEDESYRDEMIHDIEDMNEIIDQFISYVQQDRQENFDCINLNQLVKNVASAHQQVGFQIELNLKDCPDIYVSATGIKRTISNLIENAKRYGHGWLKISTTPNEQGIFLLIEDNGPGIPKSEINNLCQPFTRGNSARTTKGSGLGLAIVKKIVTKHKGKLYFKNRTAGGLAVLILLPYGEHSANTEQSS